MIEVERSAFRFYAKLCVFDFEEPRDHGKALWRGRQQLSYFSQDCNPGLVLRGAKPARETPITNEYGLPKIIHALRNAFHSIHLWQF